MSVARLVFASSMATREGAYPQFWEFMKKAEFSNMPQPLKDAFLEVNPDPQKLRNLGFDSTASGHHNVAISSNAEKGVWIHRPLISCQLLSNGVQVGLFQNRSEIQYRNRFE